MTRNNADFWRRGELEPIGVVDIGSNSVRLVVYEGAVRSPSPIFNEKVLCGLGRQVASTGRLGAESVERALAALARFRAINRILGVKNVRAIATAACREAADGPDFIVRGEAVLGTRIQVLSGEREAALAAQGIMMGFRAPEGVAGDLGGGSLELIDISVDSLRQAATLGGEGVEHYDGFFHRGVEAVRRTLAETGQVDASVPAATDEIPEPQCFCARCLAAASHAAGWPLRRRRDPSFRTPETSNQKVGCDVDHPGGARRGRAT